VARRSGSDRRTRASRARPALVLSADAFNVSAAELVTVLPITSKARAVRTRVEIDPPEGGLAVRSYAPASLIWASRC
jgi:mRNA-degrading endonuclease toxin of MazEF toxin-antitoxin module